MIRHIAAGAVLVLMAACNKPGAPADATQLAATLSGDSKGGAATNPLCKLFSVDEISAYAGTKLPAGQNAAMGAGCQWIDFHSDDNAKVLIQAVPMEYADNPSGSPGFRELPDLGKGAYVATDRGGWSAGAPQGGDFVGIIVAGPNASEKTAIDLMKETLKRRK